jgi:hypothetical protein
MDSTQFDKIEKDGKFHYRLRPTPQGPAADDTTVPPGPFWLSLSQDPDTMAWSYAVASANSSITLGTNGANSDLTSAGLDTPADISSTQLVLLESSVDVTTGVVNEDWAVVTASVGSTDANEVGLDDTPVQNYVRLLIGKVNFPGGGADPTAIQIVTECQILGHDILNGLYVSVLNAYRLHPDAIV